MAEKVRTLDQLRKIREQAKKKMDIRETLEMPSL